jgi:hypothetical protein
MQDDSHLGLGGAHDGGDLGGSGLSAESAFQCFTGAVDVTILGAGGAGHPVVAAQAVEDAAFDALHGVCLELDATLRLVLLHGVDQSEMSK